MTAQSATGTGPGSSNKRIVYTSIDTPALTSLVTGSFSQDLIPQTTPSFTGDFLGNTFFVAKNGNDATGDGSVSKPFLTVQAGINAASLVANTTPTRPCVFVMAGTYTENCVLKANVIVKGVGFNHTRVVGNWSIDSTWTPAGDWRGGLADIGIFGIFVCDFAAVSSNEGKLYCWNVRFSGSQTITAGSSISQFFMFGGEFFGTMTINGMNTVLSDLIAENNGPLVLNGQAIGTNAITTNGGSYANVTVNNTTHAFNCTFGHAVQNGCTLTINGSLSTVQACSDSIPLDNLIVLSGGATLAQLRRINNPNLSVLPVTIVNVSAPAYVIGSTEEVIFVNTTTNPVSLTLPNPVRYRKIKVKDIGGNLAVNNLTLVRFGAELIEGVAANKIFITNYISIEVQSDGTNWWIL